MTEIKEANDEHVTEMEILAETIAELQMAVTIQNHVLICLLNHFDLDKDLPSWKTKEELEKEISPKVEACMDAVKELYGRSETNKS